MAEPPAPRKPGSVTLIGAGPGDADLLTIRAARRLSAADLVLYDALSSDAMRAYAPRARWFYVGKRACRQSIGQDAINGIMIREARRGREVVRLKCGDPFVLGRGGEEMLALAAAGIACEVVPGVSTAVAGPALAGIPVTHRGMAAGFAVIAGTPRGDVPAAARCSSPHRDDRGGVDGAGQTGAHRRGARRDGVGRRPRRPRWWWARRRPPPGPGPARSGSWATWRCPPPLPVSPSPPGLLVIGEVVTVAAEVAGPRRGRRQTAQPPAAPPKPRPASIPTPISSWNSTSTAGGRDESDRSKSDQAVHGARARRRWPTCRSWRRPAVSRRCLAPRGRASRPCCA